MNTDDIAELPSGVTVRSVEEDGYELRIVAPDADALMWRLHDVVGMVQTGQFEDHLARLDPSS